MLSRHRPVQDTKKKKKKEKIMIKVTSDMLAKLLKKAHYMYNNVR